MIKAARIDSLILSQFRSYRDLTLVFGGDADIICFTGKNTAGKTNILESIFILSLLKSFQTNDIKETIMWNEEHASLSCETYIGKEPLLLTCNIVSKGKVQKSYSKQGAFVDAAQYVGSLPLVFFSPDDINLLLLSPSKRRRYIDMLLSQVDKEYMRILVNYNKVLKQRNALLRGINRGEHQIEELPYWNTELAVLGCQIYTKRHSLFTYLSRQIDSFYQMISKHDRPLHITYHPKITMETYTREDYVQAIEARVERDIFLESTSLGPHRDDFFFYIDGKSIDSFASRGDTRSMILALKLVEIQYIAETTTISPILLLDDVFSELDETRRAALVKSIPAQTQCFITTTDSDIIARDKKIQYIDVEQLST